MRSFIPLPEIKDFFDKLDAASKNGLIWGDVPGRFQYVRYNLPPIPATPTDPIQRAFFEQTCMVAYTSMAAANQRANETIARVRGQTQVNPYALDPVSGQPINPEAWGTTSGAP